jgi:glycosyltransferase involved in cell wall biosynthesis/peptidoglycan/xylan/chitin deacetylase (PgdA/CDA1 family)
MECPAFSIIIPTYQRREVVCGSIEALCRINYPGKLEIIVVVDGSTDGTAAALRGLQCPLPLQVIEQENRGAANARNRGAAEAKEEILLFLDDDMICEPDLIEQHARMYREGADAVIGQTPTHPDSAPGFLSDAVRRWIDNEKIRSAVSHWDIFTGQLSVRRSTFEAIGGFDEHYTAGEAFANEDADLGVRLVSGFNVRRNWAAVTHQKYVVTPRQYMARAKKALQADLHFLGKHPQYSRELFEARGINSQLARFAYIPLGRIPFASKMIPAAAVWMGEAALRSPFRRSRIVSRLFSGSRWVAYWAAFRQQRLLPGTERLLVLTYHAIEDQLEDPVLAPYGIPPQLFIEQLDHLLSAGFSFVSPDDFASFLVHGAPLPKRPVLLTFDDCYENLLRVARDVLSPRGIRPIAFAVTAMKSGTNEWDQPKGATTRQLLTAEQLSKLAAMGVEIGSHSRTHRDMTLLNASEQAAEARGSADDLVAEGLPRPRFFAYPFGAVDEQSRKAVEEAGYLAAFGCRTDHATGKSDRFVLPRVGIFASDRGERFRMKIRAPRLFASLEARYQRLARRIPKFGGAGGSQ